MGHLGRCRPCLFWYEGSCNKGPQCLFCHIPHDLDQVRHVRPSKKTRDRLQKHRELVQEQQALQHNLHCRIEDDIESMKSSMAMCMASQVAPSMGPCMPSGPPQRL